jgi:hypothetical protein
MTMKCLKLIALTMVSAAEALAAQPSPAIAVDCSTSASTPAVEAPNLHGNWDFVFDAAGTPNFGLLSIGRMDGGYGGSLSLWSTAPVVVRNITASGNNIRMAVGTPGGDVLFDGRLTPAGDRMCGTVTYHDGRNFPMVAQKRPSLYLSRAQAQPAQ